MGSSRNKVYAASAEPPFPVGAPDHLHVSSGATVHTNVQEPSLHLKPAATMSSTASASSSLFDWARHPRRTLLRRIIRPFQRRYKQLPWATRETFSVMITLYAIVYILVSVPLRIGFFYDPIHREDASVPWSANLTVFSILDIVSDSIGVYEFLDFYRTWQDTFSQLSQSVSFELGKKMSKKAHNHTKKPKISTRNRQASTLRHKSQAQWTLATLAPTVTGSTQSTVAVQREKMVEFVLELIALVPLEVIVLLTRQFNLLHVMRLTKLFRAHRIPDCLGKISRIYGDRRWVQQISLTGISKLVRNISIGVLLSHWFACGYMWIAHQSCGVDLTRCDPSVESSWVIRDRLMGASITRKYGRAIYWSCRTMVLLGYDDVTPVSDDETLYGLFVQVTGAVLSTSLLATFLFLFRYRNSRQAAFNTHVDNAREYMKSQQMPREVRRQVTSYFTYAWNTHHSLDGEEALHLLPKHLKSKVVYTLKASRIKQVCFLMKESVEFINLLALALVHRVYIPTDSIIEPKINAKMFFVIRGTVVLSAFDGKRPKECQTGDFFADTCLLFPEKYEEKATAKTFCELYVLEKAAFEDALGHFYRGKEQETKDRMAQTLERYATQLRKTKKLLGLRGAEDDVAVAMQQSVASHQSNKSSSKSGSGSKMIPWQMPGSSFRIRWDFIRLVATIFIAIEVPYYIVFISNHDAQKNFAVEQEIGARFFLTLAIEMFFVGDFVLRCRLFAYLDPIVMISVVDPAMIFAAYKTNGFYVDLLAVLPVALVMESMQGIAEDYSWIFRIVRLLRLRYVGELLQDLTDYYSVSSKIQLISALLLGVTLMLHMIACLWFQMSWVPLTWDDLRPDTSSLAGVTRQGCLQMATLYQNCSWVRYDCYGHVGTAFPFENTASPYTTTFAYIRSIYWAVVALTGVGYGDIVAFSTAESYFAAVWIFVGGVINFGVVGAMSSTISNLLASQHHHVEKLNSLNSIMEHVGINESLRGEIRRFYHHHFKTRKKAYESQLLAHLPDQLCYQISSLLHSESTKCVGLFDSASREFLEEVTGKFRHRTFQNGETLYIEGDICKEFVVLTHGKVDLFYQAKMVCPVGALVADDCYGANEFLLKRPHAVTLIAASHVHASVMTKEHFDVIQRKFADEMPDMKDEAYDAWMDDTTRLKTIARNMESLKLKPHVLLTPSLFYQKDYQLLSHHHSSGSDGNGGGGGGKALSGPLRRRDGGEALRSRILGVWNLMLTFWNIYSAFTVIFRIAFHDQLSNSAAQFRLFVTLDLLCDAFYFVSIYLELYYFDCDDEVGLDNLITRAEWSLAYRHSKRLKRDLVASLPLYYLSAAHPFASSICRLPRLLRTFDLWAYIDETIILAQQTFPSQNVSAYLGPLKLFFFLILGSHYAACVFFLISELECEHDPVHCWMTHDHILHQNHHSLMVLYVRSFYWALTTLTLVGSREVVPRNILGTLWAILMCLACTFVMGYIIGELSELILDMGKEAKEYKSKIDSFEHFAKERGLSETMRSRVALFFKVQSDHDKDQELAEAVHDLSANLKLKLMHEIYGSAITTLPISRFLTNAQVNNLALRLQTELFIPADDIVVEDTAGSRLCILRKGFAAVLWSESVTSVAVLMEGCLFGEVAFFVPRQQRIATVKAITSCEVLHISKLAWKELWSGTGGTASNIEESHVQKYALHSILDWVKGRLFSYQENALNVAKRINRQIMERKIMENLKGMMAPAVSKLRYGAGLGHKLAHGRSFLTPEVLVLEKKAKYLLHKVDKYAQQNRHSLNDHHGIGGGGPMSATSVNLDQFHHVHKRRASTQAAAAGESGHKMHKTTLKTVDLNFGQCFAPINPVNKHVIAHIDDHHLKLLEDECWRRFRYMATLQHTVAGIMEVLMPRQRAHQQHHQSPSASAAVGTPATGKRRDSIMSHARHHGVHRVGDALETTVPLKRMHTFHADDAAASASHRQAWHDQVKAQNQAQSPKSVVGGVVAVPRTDTCGRNSVALTRLVAIQFDNRLSTNMRPPPLEEPVKRLESQQSGRFLLTRTLSGNTSPATTDSAMSSSSSHLNNQLRAAMLRRMKRCHSLPTFDTKYFDAVKTHEDATRRTIRGGVGGMENTLIGTRGIDFDILQKCRRPKLSTLYQWYRRFKKWQSDDGRGSWSAEEGSHHSEETASSAVTGNRSKRNSAAVNKVVQSSKRSHGNAADHYAQAFQALVKKISKAWDLVMLLIASYHAIAVPLKVCFVDDLQLLHGLKVWSAMEYFMDFLCLLDVVHRVRQASAQVDRQVVHASRPHHASSGGGGKNTHGSHHHHHRKNARSVLSSLVARIRPASLYEGFMSDVIAVLPLEILALALSHWHELSYANKWLRLCFLRINKVFFTTRIQELSSRLFQYAVYDLKFPVAEPLLNFLRSLIKYLLMGHWIACLWFALSEKAYQDYAISWISYAGMLVFALNPSAGSSSSSSGHTTAPTASAHRLLSTSTSAESLLDLHTVPLARKYLRSMHFAIGSITTLWYGDISSLNVFELFVEFAVIISSIYILGSLVGAHGELLESNSRRQAIFEQNLTELQHYLIQNNVPKDLKKQIKQYYASIWRRRNGEEEFEAIANISRALYEDVVYMTLHRFVWKVSIFHALDVHFLRALLVKLQYVVCSENEEVVIRGDVDRSMYFISHGRVLVKQDKSEITKEKGDFFGELALLYGIPRGETCIALCVCELYRLDAAPYEELLLEFPEYRAKNRTDWTTADPPPSALTSLLHSLTLSGAAQSLGDAAAIAAAGSGAGADDAGAINLSAVLDEEVARSFVYKSSMELLAQFGDVDSLQAKRIVILAKRGARRQLKATTGIETARGAVETAGDDDISYENNCTENGRPMTRDGERRGSTGRPRSPTARKRSVTHTISLQSVARTVHNAHIGSTRHLIEATTVATTSSPLAMDEQPVDSDVHSMTPRSTDPAADATTDGSPIITTTTHPVDGWRMQEFRQQLAHVEVEK